MISGAIFALGTLTVLLSLAVAVRFRKYGKSLDGSGKQLSTALSWQLAGESVIGLGTLVFATAAHFGCLSSWSLEIQSSIRLVMFVATSVTTVHLWRVVKRINES